MTFTMWSMGHIAFMISPFVLAGMLYCATKHHSYDVKRRVGIILMGFAVVLLLARNIEIWFYKDFTLHYEIIPLQICHFANFVLLAAFMKNNKILYAFAFTLNLPAALASIIFANGLENYATLLTYRGVAYILGHMLIVSMTLFAYMHGFVKLNQAIIKKLFKVLVPLYALAHVINNLFIVFLDQRANYFYTIKPEPGTPLETFFDLGKVYTAGPLEINPLYMILTGLLGAGVIVLLYMVDKSLPYAPPIHTKKSEG